MEIVHPQRVIHWRSVDDELPEDTVLVVATGHYQGMAGTGRWIALARRVDGHWYSDETGDELLHRPTHWHEVILPDD